MSNAKKRVLLAASRDWTGTARLPGMLARAGIEVSLLHDGAVHTAASSHLAEVIAAGGGPAGVAEALSRIADGYDRVVVTDEPLIEVLCARSAETWTRRLLPSSDVESARALVDKTRFALRAGETRLPRPAVAVVDGVDDLKAAVVRIGPPVMVKGARGMAGSTVRRACDLASALAAAEELAEWPLLVEEVVAGPVAMVAGLFAEGRFIAGFVAEKVTTVGPEGPSAIVRLCAGRGDEIDLASRTGSAFALDGFASLDVICSPARGPVLIEINPRPVPPLHLGRRAGADIGRALAHLLDGRTPDAPVVPVRDVVARQFPQELQRMRRDMGRRRGTLRWALDPRDWRELPWGDRGLLREYLR
jgi:biotin carboxylase